eukprot:13567406-Alexandrium_andersonii.AAC.1
MHHFWVVHVHEWSPREQARPRPRSASLTPSESRLVAAAQDELLLARELGPTTALQSRTPRARR